MSLETCKYEVLTLLREEAYTKKEITDAAENLRGMDGISMVMDKLSYIYGVMDDSERLLAQFYNGK